MTQQATVERRSVPRTVVAVPVVCQRVHARGADVAWTGRTEDLSSIGMAVRFDDPGPSPATVGDVIEADVSVDDLIVPVRGLVVSVEGIGSALRIRCAFAMTGTEASREALADFCARVA
jgi:hypothetical protein